jgi:aminodeoxyfutalosine deaminase
VRTRAADSLDAHPLPRLLAAGVPVTLSTDDPGMFDTDLNREYAAAAELCNLDEPGIAELARAGVRAAFCDEEQRSRLLAEIDAVLAAAR